MLLVDTAAGVSEGVMSFARAAQDVLVVVCDEPASLADAYALIKLLSTQHGVSRFRVLANMVRRARDGRELFGKLLSVCDQYLDVVLEFAGVVPFDDYLRKAVQRRAVGAWRPSRAARRRLRCASWREQVEQLAARQRRQRTSGVFLRAHVAAGDGCVGRFSMSAVLAYKKTGRPEVSAQEVDRLVQRCTRRWSSASPITCWRACRPACRWTT